MIEKGLVTYLSSDSNITALVSDRIYGSRMPQSPTYPNIVYSRISADRDRTVEGANGIERARIQLDCRARTYGEAKDLAAAVIDSIEDYSGLMGTITVRHVAIDNDNDFYDPDAEAERVSIDAIITYER